MTIVAGRFPVTGGDAMDILIEIVIGGVIGWIAGMIMKTEAQAGILMNVVVGIVGSSLGAWIFGMLGFSAGGGIARWIVAIVGAMVLIAILKAVNVLK
jgi:uncharacterized membrane protein YeaQ/YmgE (transglycosylase-associated protein family)